MNGLILKDIYTLRNYKIIIAGIFILTFVLSLASQQSLTIIIVSSATYLSTIMVGTFNYDESAKWERSAISLPITRAHIVAAKYITSLILIGCYFPVVVIVGIIGSLMQRGAEFFLLLLVSILIALCLFLLMIAVAVPAIYQFGVEKGRYVLSGFLVAIFVVVMLVIYRFREQASTFEDSHFITIIALCTLATLLFFIASYFLSVRIYSKKDY